MTTTTISVNGLRLRAFHGVMEQERRVGNTFELSISLRYPSLEAIATDDISHALNYGEVIETARREPCLNMRQEGYEMPYAAVSH